METILEISPWPENSILHYTCIEDGNWGYLIIYLDLTYRFDSERVPTNAEILERWAYRFSGAHEMFDGEKNEQNNFS